MSGVLIALAITTTLVGASLLNKLVAASSRLDRALAALFPGGEDQ